MKKLIRYSFVILAAFSLLACSDPESEVGPDPGTGPVPEPSVPEVLDEVISFETDEQLAGVDGKLVALRTISVVSGKNSLSHDNVYWAKEYTEALGLKDEDDQLYFANTLFTTKDVKTSFASYYCDCTIFGMQLDSWGGFVLSSNGNKTVAAAQAGQGNQFEVYANGGAEGSKTFAVCYDAKTAGMAMNGVDCCWPQIDFATPREPLSIALANSTWTYHFFNGAKGDSYIVKITGSKDGIEVGSVDCSLISGAEKVSDWTNFDLSSLGQVDRLVFKVKSTASYAPFYFCVDDIVLKNNK